MKLELIATTAFGLEALVRREIESLGMKITSREDGRIGYITDERGLVRSNLWLRCADRVFIKMGEFRALEFEDLFQGMKGIAWETLLPLDGNFVVNVSSVKSKLSSIPACQSVAEKGLISRLGETYGDVRFPKTGALFNIRIRILKDTAVVTVDTSGPGLHKRSYRVKQLEAPIKETLAAAMIQLSFWKPGRILIDPFAGSGTIAIEAAMIGRNIAPGLGRAFAAEDWAFIKSELWKEEKALAYKAIKPDTELDIRAYDINPSAVSAMRENIVNAGVDECISVKQAAFENLAAPEPHSIVITNPPYGERIGERPEIERIYVRLGELLAGDTTLSLYLITTDKDFEQLAVGRPADRRRKLYNGRLETTFYQYYGKRD
jgi:putative N6-adenine-specific DNA methylase